MSKSYNFTETSWKAITVSSDNTLRERVPATVFSNYIYAKFESSEIKIIKEYEIYLRAVYGDYMVLPPIEQRATHHRFRAFKVQ